MILTKFIKNTIFEIEGFQNRSNVFVKIISVDKDTPTICFIKQCDSKGKLIKKGHKSEMTIDIINNFLKTGEYKI